MGLPGRAAGLEHRLWLLDGIPAAEELEALRVVGVSSLVVPVGSLQVERKSARFTVASLPDLSPLRGWTVSALVWVEGSGRDEGGAADFVSQLAPVERLLPGNGGVILASREYWEGLPRFAVAVARRTGRPVEIAASAESLVAAMPRNGWRGVTATPVAFGLPALLGFPDSTFHDDERSLDELADRGVRFRVAVVTGYRVDPRPVSAELQLAQLAQREVATFRPGSRGNTFTLVRSVTWGGRSFQAGDSLVVEGLETARYHRGMAGILRRVRPGLLGWDTVGLPAPAPTIGMNREAFLEYFRGALPVAVPEVEAEAAGTGIRISVRNPTPFSSALATTGNYLEVRFAGAQIRDVQPGRFSGVEYGRYERGRWQATAAREATAVRFFMTLFGPKSEHTGAGVQFFSRPRELRVGWRIRDPDGRERSGAFETVDITR